MPIRFHCPYCNQRLSVGTRKAGTEAECPKCKQTLRVPEADQIAESEERKESKERAAELATTVDGSSSGVGPSLGPDLAENNELFEEFVVYDDDGPLVADDVEVVTPPEADVSIDYGKVAVPRWVLFTQGILLGVVGLACFVFGLMIGARSAPQPSNQDPVPCVITGEVQYDDGGPMPDSGAVVIVLPKEAHPETRVNATGLSPLGPPPLRDDARLAEIRGIGGGYTRTDQAGNYRLRVPDRGDYFVLIVSRGKEQADDTAFDVTSAAQIGRYFVPALDLMGEQSYAWKSESIRGDTTINHVFE